MDDERLVKDIISLGRILNSSFNEIYIFNQNSLEFLYANQGLLRNSGYSLEELLQLTPLDLKPEFSLDSFRSLLKPLLNGDKKQVFFESYHLRKDKTTYPVDVFIQTSVYNGDPVFVTFILDITSRENIKDDLKDQELILKAVFDTAVDGIITINDRGIIENINLAGEQIFGYNRGNLIGKNISYLMPEPDHSKHDSYIKNYLTTGKAKIIGIGREVSGKKKDGTIFPFRLGISEVSLQGRKMFIGIIHDITGMKLVEEKLLKYSAELEESNRELEKRVTIRTQKLADAIETLKTANHNLEFQISETIMAQENERSSTRLYKAIVNNFPDGIICLLDFRLNLLLINGMDLKKISLSSHQLVGKNLLELIPENLVNDAKSHLNIVFQGKDVTLEHQFGEGHFHISMAPINNDKGQVYRVLIVVKDITQRKIAEEEILRSLAKEKELNELKSRFVTMASHEFRTPLSTILSSASLVGKYNQPDQEDKRLKHINRIKSSVGNLTNILNDFLSLAKLEEGRVELSKNPFNIAHLATTIVGDMQGIVKTGQTISYEHSGEEELVNLDKNIVRNIVFNLISNAIKYSGTGSQVIFNTTIQDNILTIKVQDQGIGIPEFEQQFMFDRFFRAKNVQNIEGTGLGLNIVKKYIELMEGSISFVSEVEKGTTFKVELPIN